MMKRSTDDYDGEEMKISHPRIAHGQRYPMPCLE